MTTIEDKDQLSNLLLPRSQRVSSSDRLNEFLSEHWFSAFVLLFGFYIALPFLAPALMNIGWTGLGLGIYKVYSYLCHQLPERSFFLFGPKISYSLAELKAAGANITDMGVLRQFIGTPVMGWKVGWSDRMVYMFTSVLLFGLIWRPLRKRIPSLPWWGLILFLLPMFFDGITHMISDFAGLGLGFRDTNAWLVPLTNQAFSPTFYAGDALGSFNSWMRLITGVLFGVGIVWFGFPYLEEAFTAPTRYKRLRAEQDRQLLEKILHEANHPTP